MSTRWAGVWLACFALIVSASATTLLLVRAMLAPESRAAFADMLDNAATLLAIAAIAALALSAVLARWITHAYFAPLRRYAELTRLIAISNPGCRLQPGDPRELRELAAAINEFAARHEHTLHEVETQITRANASLARERGQLAALMSDLAQSVVVCNAEGLILLYNEQARRLLEACAPRAFLGLGRPVHDLLDRDTLEGAYAGLRARLEQGELRPVAEFTIVLPDGSPAQVRMAPVAGDGCEAAKRTRCATWQPEGFVLLISAAHHPAPAPPAQAPAADARPVFYDFDLFHQPGQACETDDRPLRELAYTVFDTETTGLEPGAGDEIISIGAVRIVNGRLLHGETYEQLVDPRRALNPQSMRVHGITPQMLAGKPLIDAVLPRFHRFCAGTVLVGHNVAFDLRFLQLKEASSGARFTYPVLDTLLLSSALHGDALEHRLDDIAARLGIAPTGRHTALGDAVTTARVFLKLMPLLEARGIITLQQARDASARTLHARISY